MNRILSEVLTVDNALHALVAVAFTVGLWALAVFGLPAWFGITMFAPVSPVIYAVLAGIGLYLREAAQVEWDFTLRWSLHKWAEAITGTVVALIAAGVLTIIEMVMS